MIELIVPPTINDQNPDSSRALVLTIGASDNMGCSGLQRDAQTILALGVHPVQVCTGQTIQSSCSLVSVVATSIQHFKQQLEFVEQQNISTIKIGAIISVDQFLYLTEWLRSFKSMSPEVFVVWDPVVETSCGQLLCEPELLAMLTTNDTEGYSLSTELTAFLKHIDLITPNVQEAQLILGKNCRHLVQLVEAVNELISVNSLSHLFWLQKGGHDMAGADILLGKEDELAVDFLIYRDHLLSLHGYKVNTKNGRGTGCALSSSIASFVAKGQDIGDSLVLAKWTINEGLRSSYSVNDGKGPVFVRGIPNSNLNFPKIVFTKGIAIARSIPSIGPSIKLAKIDGQKTNHSRKSKREESKRLKCECGPKCECEPKRDSRLITPVALPSHFVDKQDYGFDKLLEFHQDIGEFAPCDEYVTGIYPIVDRAYKLSPLIGAGCRILQLRIKQGSTEFLRDEISAAVQICNENKVSLFVNDHWQLAIQCGAFGVHLGQSDLSIDALKMLAQNSIRLGLSSHNYFELARAQGINPSYIAFGPVFPTQSKVMPWQPQGIARLQNIVKLVKCPLVAIGGIDLSNIESVAKTRVAAAAMIGAFNQPTPVSSAKRLIRRWQNALN